MNKRLLAISIGFLSLVTVLTGCWDAKDIEERGFIVGISIDLADIKPNGNYELSVTNQFVVPAGIGTPGEGPTPDKKAYTNIVASGESLFEISRKMDAKTSKIPYFEQLKVVLVSEEIARQQELFSSLMDLFIRDHEMRRGIRIIITKGKARELLEINPGQSERIPAIYIDSYMENITKSKAVVNPVRIGEVQEYLLEQRSFVLPLMYVTEGTINNTGAAVFRGYKNTMVGTLNEEETLGRNFITSNTRGSAVNFEINDHLMALEVLDSKPKVTIKSDNPDQIDISVHVKISGGIAEMFGDRTLLDEAYLKKIGEKVSKKVEGLIQNAVDKAQKDLQVDIFNFGDKLNQHHYWQWKKIENDWDHGKNIFSKSNITVSVDTEIREIGSSDKAKDR